MARAAAALRGRHDFHSFETDWPNRMSSVRTITHLAVNRIGDWIWLDVEADGFLYNMVRAIAGTLMNVGRGYWPESQVAEILQAEDRTRPARRRRPQGLFLMRVTYESVAGMSIDAVVSRQAGDRAADAGRRTATVRVPGSKSITNRALVLAALAASGVGCELRGVLRSEDTEVMIDSAAGAGLPRLSRLGRVASVYVSAGAGRSRSSPPRRRTCSSANSGTTMRFLTALVSLGHGRYRLDGVPRMRERPIAGSARRPAATRRRRRTARTSNGCPPVIIEADGLHGRARARITGDVSSQFLSGLLMAAPFADARRRRSRSRARWSRGPTST